VITGTKVNLTRLGDKRRTLQPHNNKKKEALFQIKSIESSIEDLIFES